MCTSKSNTSDTGNSGGIGSFLRAVYFRKPLEFEVPSGRSHLSRLIISGILIEFQLLEQHRNVKPSQECGEKKKSNVSQGVEVANDVGKSGCQDCTKKPAMTVTEKGDMQGNDI